jgi:hypothetical protein
MTRKPPLGCRPARGRKAAEPAARRDHAMTRHDDRERVASQGLPDLARRSRIAEPRRYLAIGERFARRDGARQLVNTSIELRHATHIEGNLRKIGCFAAQECDNAVDCGLHGGWGRHFFGVGAMPKQAGARFGFRRFRELHSHYTELVPDDAAASKRRSEKGKAS